MADHASFSDDISALWVSQDDSLPDPARNGAVRPDPEPDSGDEGEGAPAVVEEREPDGVAALADALASHQVDVVPRRELDALRREMEGAFTNQLAVALFEMLNASNNRFARAEEHFDERLQAIADQLADSLERHADHLASTIDAQQRANSEGAERLRNELAMMRDQAVAPSLTLASMQDQAARLAELVGQHERTTQQGADAVDRLVHTSGELSERLDGSVERASVEHASRIDELSARVTSLQSDVAALHEAITGLREGMTARRRGWMGRRG